MSLVNAVAQNGIHLEGLRKVVEHLSHFAVQMDGKVHHYRTRAIAGMEADEYVRKWGDAPGSTSLRVNSVQDMKMILAYYNGEEERWTHKAVLNSLASELERIKKEKAYQGVEPQTAAYFLPSLVAESAYPMLSILHGLKTNPSEYPEWGVSPPFLANARLEGEKDPLIGFHDERLREKKVRELVHEGWNLNQAVCGREEFSYTREGTWEKLQFYVISDMETEFPRQLISTADRMNKMRETIVWVRSQGKSRFIRKLYEI